MPRGTKLETMVWNLSMSRHPHIYKFLFFLGSKSLLECWISSVFDQLLWELGGQDMGKNYYRITNTDREDQ